MLPIQTQAIAPSDLLRLDAFLHSDACGREAMGLSRAHGFLAAAASGPEQLEPAEWLRLVFDEPVFANGDEAEAMLGLALRLYQEIENSLGHPGSFLPVLDFVRGGAGGVAVDASAWCQGYFSGMSLCREQWAWHASQGLGALLNPILRLAASPASDTGYRQQCDQLPATAQAIYHYWREHASAG